MKLPVALLSGVALSALSFPAFADDADVLKRLDAMQKMLEAQQHQIEVQRAEIESQSHEIVTLKRSLSAHAEPAAAKPEAAPQPAASQQAQIDALKTELDSYKTTERLHKQDEPVWSYAAGRPMVQSPDGRFTFAVRALAQFDTGYYDQSDSASRLPSSYGPSLNSGSNFRRAQVGFAGKLFGDWAYLLNYDFGGSGGNESPGHVQAVYLEYDGLKPFAIRAGAYPPPAGIEDGTPAGDTIFLERNAPADAARAIAGADGRDAVTALYMGDALYAALSLTGGKATDSSTNYSEQKALLGRVSDLVYSDGDWKFLVGVNGSHVFTPPYSAVGMGSAHAATISAAPELTIDGTKLVSTGAINADHVDEWGVEAAAEWRSLYGQGGYFGYRISRADGLSDPNFNGWYLQGSWILTGEQRGYSKTNGAFTAPKPSIPFSIASGGMGAWELALRYSDLDLNYNEGVAGSAAPAGGVRGGEQKILTAGINWYPESLIRFALDFEHINTDRLSTSSPYGQVGQSLNTIALRSQVGF